MAKRITAIVGAGAVLDFDFSYEGAVCPSTKNITESICNLSVQGLDVEESDVISKVYGLAKNTLSDLYRKRGIKQDYDLNFEELYFLLESMFSLGEGTEYYDPHGFPLLAALLDVKREIKEYPHIEYVRALHAIVRKISNIIDGYDSRFSLSTSEEWYKKFWQGRENLKYDVFTFNYDTTIEQSVEDYEDGYRPIVGNRLGIQYFDSHALLRNKSKRTTIQHLHGSIYYAEYAPIECVKTHSNRDMFKMRTVAEAIGQLGLQTKDQSQARELFLNSPILIGMRKLDKMTFLPSSVYHADLVNRLQKNRGVLIVGYSFGDLYVNQILQRRLLMQGTKHRMVIIDYFPRYVDSAVGVYRYLSDERPQLRAFMTPFFDLRFDDFKLKGMHFMSYDEPIYNEERNCVLFICGFKRTIELYGDFIQRFL